MLTIGDVRTVEKNVQEGLNYFSVEESTALLRAIFPNYPDLKAVNPVPGIGAFLRTLRINIEP